MKRLAILILLMFFISSCCLTGPQKPSPKEEVILMEVTAYCDCGECCGYYRSCFSCWTIPYFKNGPHKGERKKIGITADGSKAKKGTIAADIRKYPFGTKMYVPGYGWGEVHDVGSAIKGNHIDIFFSSHERATKWGRQSLKVRVIRK